MPFCAHCGWRYAGEPRFCRECGRPILRRMAGSWRNGGAHAETAARARLRIVDAAEMLRETPAQCWRRRGAIFGLALLAGLAFVLVGAAASMNALGSLPTDEAWVRLVYARNLAQTLHLEFNAGQGEAGVGSILWVGAMALLIKTLGGLGINVIALAKGTSLIAAALAAVLAAELGRHLAGSTLAGLAVGALVALDPTFAFAGVTGVETTVFAALALGTCLALACDRPLATGILLASCILVSLEGLVLLPLVTLALAVPLLVRIARRDESAPPSQRELAALAMALGPPLVAVALWLALDTPTGRALPAPIYALRAQRPGVPLPDLAGLWTGYLDPWVGYLGAGAWIVGGPTIVFAAVWLLRERRWRVVPVVLFAPLVLLGVAALLPLPHEPWPFGSRRHLDALLPFLALQFVLGVRSLWREGQALWAQWIPLEAESRPRWALAVVGVPLIAALVPVSSTVSLWDHLPREYARASRAMNDTYFALARYARDSLPEQALIAAIEPGALRYVSRRPVADLTGVHTPVLAGRPPLEALADARADFAAFPRERLYESAPGSTLLRDFTSPTEDPDAPKLGLFKVALGATTSPRDGVYAFPTDRLNRLDYLDVGNEQSERDHNYTVVEPREIMRRAMRVTTDRSVADEGRAWIGAEAVTLRSEPGRDLIVARRFDASTPGGFRVTVDGQPFGEWWPRPGAYGLAEDTLRLPGQLVRGPRVVVRLELIPQSAPQVASFGYWSFVER